MPNITRIAQIFEASGMFNDAWTPEDLTRATTAAYFGLVDPEDRAFVQKLSLELDKDHNAKILDDLKKTLITHEMVREKGESMGQNDTDFERQQVPLIDIPLQ